MVAHTCSPSYLGDWGGKTAWAQEFEAAVAMIVLLHSSLGNRARFCLKNKQTNKQKTEEKNSVLAGHSVSHL